MPDFAKPNELLALTTQIVVAHVTKSHLPISELPTLFERVHQSLMAIGAPPPANPFRPKPAAPISKSVMPNYIVCLEDGRKLKMLKRHLMTTFKLTPAQYRQRWELPSTYPMTAPNYAKLRSSLAKKLGLGRLKRSR